MAADARDISSMTIIWSRYDPSEPPYLAAQKHGHIDNGQVMILSILLPITDPEQ